MMSLFTPVRLRRLAGFVSTQVAVQALGFVSGIVLVRAMAPAEYGYYTLAITLVGVASVLTELGLATAVLALGGRLAGTTGALAGLVADATALHRRMAAIGLGLVLPAFVLLMLHQQAPLPQALALALLGGACAWCQVRSAIALSVARLAGDLARQQALDLAVGLARLAALALAAPWLLDATVAGAVNLLAAAATFLAWRRYLAARAGAEAPRDAPGTQTPALREAVARQAPNCIYYVVNGQLAIWLIALFGTADRVAEIGALGRLGAGFAVIAAVIGAVIQPYFARNHGVAALESGFLAVNAFFAALLAGLVGLAWAFPAEILWVLGGHYARLGPELRWMMAAVSLTAWSGALYSIGCGRGWVLPGRLGIGCGLAATLLGIRCFDLATVAGNLALNVLTAGVGTVVTFAYVGGCLLRYRRTRLIAS